MSSIQFLVEGINPEPWTIKTGGGRVYSPEAVRSYKAAIRETVEDALKERKSSLPYFSADTPLAVHFYFWRQLDTAFTGAKSKRARAHHADVTNLVKSTEDALQGVLYENDRDNRIVRGQLMDMGPDVACGVLVMAWELHPNTHQEIDGVRARLLRMNHHDTTKTVYFNE